MENLTENEIGVLIEALWASRKLGNLSVEEVVLLSEKLERLSPTATSAKTGDDE